MSSASAVENKAQANKAKHADSLLNMLFDRYLTSGKSIEDYVKTLDIDDSGDVSVTELGIIMVNRGIKAPPRVVKVLFQKLDRNGSGKVQGAEFNLGLTQILKEREGSGGRFGAGLQPEKAVYGEQFLLQKLERCQKEQSFFFRDFTKPEMKTLMQFSEGTIQYEAGEVIVPKGEHGHWVGLLFEGKYVDCLQEGDPNPHAHYTVGSFLRQFEFMDAYVHHDHSHGPPKKIPKQPKVPHGEKRRGVDGHKTDHAGAMDEEYLQGSANDGGAMLVWSVQNIREMAANGHDSLAQKFIRKVGISMISDVKERLHHGHQLLEDYKDGKIVPACVKKRFEGSAAPPPTDNTEMLETLNAEWGAKLSDLEKTLREQFEKEKREMEADFQRRLEEALAKQEEELQAEFARQLKTQRVIGKIREEMIRAETTKEKMQSIVEDEFERGLAILRSFATHVAEKMEGSIESLFETIGMLDKRGSVKNGSVNQKKLKTLFKTVGVDPSLKSVKTLTNFLTAATGKGKPDGVGMCHEIRTMMECLKIKGEMAKVENFEAVWTEAGKAVGTDGVPCSSLVSVLEKCVPQWESEDAAKVANVFKELFDWDEEEPVELGELMDALQRALAYNGQVQDEVDENGIGGYQQLVSARNLLVGMRAHLKITDYNNEDVSNAMEVMNHQSSDKLGEHQESTHVTTFKSTFDVGSFEQKPPTPEPPPPVEEEEDEPEEIVVVEKEIVIEKIVEKENKGKLGWSKLRQNHMQKVLNKKKLAMALKDGQMLSLSQKRRKERLKTQRLEEILRLTEKERDDYKERLRKALEDLQNSKTKVAQQAKVIEKLKLKIKEMALLIGEHEGRISDLEAQLAAAMENLRLADEKRRDLEGQIAILERRGDDDKLAIERLKSSYKALHSFLGFQILSMSTLILKLKKDLRFARGQANRATRYVESLQQKLNDLKKQHEKELEELRAKLMAERKRADELGNTLQQTEDAAKYAVQQILQRLRVSEMRTGELEKRFSSMSRPSTALLDAISHLDLGFMRQPLPGMDQLEILEEKPKVSRPRGPVGASALGGDLEPFPPSGAKMSGASIRMQTYPKGPRKNVLPIPGYNSAKPKRFGPSGAWRTKNMRNQQADAKRFGIRHKKKLSMGSTSMYDYDYGDYKE